MRGVLSRSPIGLLLMVTGQLICSAFFIYDMLTSVFLIPTRPLDWELREMLDVGAALGLVAGFALGTATLWRVLHERNVAERDRNAAEQARAEAELRLRRAASDFHALLEERFTEWDFTAAERDVALFALKGLSLAQIAALRETTEGTVKTQTNAIYRKAGVSGRPQFLSLFIEDLLMGEARPEAAPVGMGVGAGAMPPVQPAAPARASAPA